jgi:hypothetical protein
LFRKEIERDVKELAQETVDSFNAAAFERKPKK